jgi:hypothetical protein
MGQNTEVTNADIKLSTMEIPHQGKFTSTISCDTGQLVTDFYVAKGPGQSLLSYATSCELGLIHTTFGVNSSTDKVVSAFADILADKNKIGCLNDRKVKLHNDDSIPGVVQPHRRIPFHVRKAV